MATHLIGIYPPLFRIALMARHALYHNLLSFVYFLLPHTTPPAEREALGRNEISAILRSLPPFPEEKLLWEGGDRRRMKHLLCVQNTSVSILGITSEQRII